MRNIGYFPKEYSELSSKRSSLHFPKRQILGSSKVKAFAHDNFNFDENGRRFSRWVENTVGKGEISRYEQFLLFPQSFQKTYSADMQKPGLVWERVNRFALSL